VEVLARLWSPRSIGSTHRCHPVAPRPHSIDQQRPTGAPDPPPALAKINDSILDAIGNTPLVRLNQIGKRHGCEILAKCEFMNPGGSVKDRIGARMVLEAEKAGRIKPGDTLIEPTSGNTGIGMAMAAAARGYRMIITMPEKMSREKQVVLEALGAEILRTPTEAAWDAPESHIGVANQLQKILPNAHILDQYSNPDNPAAHYHGTAVEILEQTGGQLDMFVASAGTGGTLSGTAKRLKEECPDVRIVGVDPEGSILAGPGPIGSYKVEGIGYDFIPDVLDRSLVDEWIRSRDRESFLMARRLIRQEGLLCGGSCGAAVWAAVQMAEKYGPGKRIVVILPDSVRNYMTKFMDDQWMRENGFTESRWETSTVGDMLRALKSREVLTAASSDTLADSVMTMKEHGVSQLPVLDGGKLVGIVTESDLLSKLVEGRASLSSAVAEVMFRNVSTVNVNDDAGTLRHMFADGLVGIAIDDDQRVHGVVTKMDLVDFLTNTIEAATVS
jgi:cystathionine beta-synthase